MSPLMLQPKAGHVPIKQALRRAADFTKPAETNPEIGDSVEVLAERWHRSSRRRRPPLFPFVTPRGETGTPASFPPSD